jgi:hypothetical protein
MSDTNNNIDNTTDNVVEDVPDTVDNTVDNTVGTVVAPVDNRKQSEIIFEQIDKLNSDIVKYQNHADFDQIIREQNAAFYDKYPTLFNKIVEKEMNYDVLRQLLKALDNVNNGEQSQHDASVSVGQVLVDNYVKPQLDKK